VGTTSAKALVVSQTGEILATAQEFYATQHPQLSHAEQDAPGILVAVKKIMKDAASKAAAKIDGVCFSSAMHSLMATDDKGSPLTPLIIWADLRSSREARDIADHNGQAIYEETGTPIHPMSPLCKIIWLKKNQPGLFKNTTRFIGIKEFLWFDFFGEFLIDHSVASASGLFNIQEKSWSRLALSAAGITAGQLSEPCSAYTERKLGPGKAAELGLLPGTPFIIGANDGCLANLGSGAMDEQTLSLTVGTSGAVRKAVKANRPDSKGRTFNYLLDDKILISGGATNNGAILVQWYAEKILKEKVNVKTFGERANVIAPGAEGLILLPFLLGERAPVYDPESTGVFFGVCQRHTTEHFMRAIMEGVGFALYSIASIVEENSGSYSSVMASGGFIKSSHWVQIMSDIFGKPFVVRGTDDASSLGAALMGFKALGIQTDFAFPNQKDFNPNLDNHRLYQNYFGVYRNLYAHLAGDFRLLHQAVKG
jgi:gluconokinase